MPKSSFRPIHEDHAILEQMIFFQFAPALDQIMPALLPLKDELAQELPQSEMLRSFQVDITDGALTNRDIKDAAGINIFKDGPSGKEWLISISGASISIHCTKYTRWDEVWPIQQRYISSIFSRIVHLKSFLMSVGLKWIDQFIYEGTEEDYRTDHLLRKRSPHLHAGAFNSGPQWHCHTGWFDKSTFQQFKVLNQLNVDSVRINEGGRLRTAVTIDHTQQLRADQQVDLLAGFLPTTAGGLIALSGLMEALHHGNKRVLADLLIDAMRERIGLEVEQLG